MLEAYRQHVEERAKEGLPPLALNAEQVADLIELIKNPPAGEEEYIVDLLVNRVPPGVDQAAYVKAAFLADIAEGKTAVSSIDRAHATFLLGTMLGGYNIDSGYTSAHTAWTYVAGLHVSGQFQVEFLRG